MTQAADRGGENAAAARRAAGLRQWMARRQVVYTISPAKLGSGLPRASFTTRKQGNGPGAAGPSKARKRLRRCCRFEIAQTRTGVTAKPVALVASTGSIKAVPLRPLTWPKFTRTVGLTDIRYPRVTRLAILFRQFQDSRSHSGAAIQNSGAMLSSEASTLQTSIHFAICRYKNLSVNSTLLFQTRQHTRVLRQAARTF